ncbi:MAG TPA: FAD-dependent monooxygenase [Rhodopila sp.]|nr:FAD-dependent monooxygenase [Rhodopila sp.]
MEPQVLIVGAGPVGLTMAGELARYGVSARIVDKAAQRTDKSKALVIWSRTLELLDRAGSSEAFVAAGHKVTGANIIAGGRAIGHISIDTVGSPYPYALIVPQSDTERLLETQGERFGVRVERSVELTGFVADDDGVAATLRHDDGREETVRSAWLIGCDGAHSLVRHRLGLAFEGDTLQSDWFLADVHLRGLPFPDSDIATYWHQDGALVFFPISPGRYRVIADRGRAEGDAPETPTLDQVQAVLDRRGPAGVVVSDPIWLSGFRINERKVRDYRSGRVFLAGDAAHVHSPAGGQGMNTGMQDAINLAWKLAMVCRGRCPERVLDSYSAERSEVGRQVLKAAGRLTEVAVMRNPVAQIARNLAGWFLLGLAPVRRAMVETMTEVSLGYPHSPLNGRGLLGFGPEPGERMTPVAGEAPVGSGDVPRFALFGAEGETTSRLLRMYPDLLETAVRPPVRADWVWLVRPDGYVACVGAAGDSGVFEEYLGAFAG